MSAEPSTLLTAIVVLVRYLEIAMADALGEKRSVSTLSTGAEAKAVKAVAMKHNAVMIM